MWFRSTATLALHVRGLQALGTGHILRAGVTQDLHSRGTARTGQLCARQRCGRDSTAPELRAVRTDREPLVEKRVLPHPVLQTGAARPHLWQQQSHHGPVLTPGQPVEGSAARTSPFRMCLMAPRTRRLSTSPHSCPPQPGANLLRSKGVTANPSTPLTATAASPPPASHAPPVSTHAIYSSQHGCWSSHASHHMPWPPSLQAEHKLHLAQVRLRPRWVLPG